jgi:DNA-binding response OmpR family regulator
VLIVEDDAFQRQVVSEYLSAQGVSLTAVADPPAFRATIERGIPDVVLLDVGLPGEDGFSLARWLRARNDQVGIIMLTSATDLVDRVLGLESGADDYLTKPFESRELLARIRAVVRRAGQGHVVRRPVQTTMGGSATMFGGAVLRLEQRLLVRPDGRTEALTDSECSLLHLLMQHPNRPLHRDWLLEATAPDGETEAQDRAIDLRIMRLRRKLEVDPENPQIIRTVRGVGYIFVRSERQ